MMVSDSSAKLDYIQLPLKTFVQQYPGILMQIPFCLIIPKLLQDDKENKYLVRLKDGRIEFGYGEDAWLIQ